jgi:hypothetical protein
VTSNAVCPKHETPNRELVLHSMALDKKVYICDECERETTVLHATIPVLLALGASGGWVTF